MFNLICWKAITKHVIFGKIEPRPGSVTARMASPVQNFYFHNPTEGELCFPLKLSRDNEGQRTPEDSGSRGRVRESQAEPVSQIMRGEEMSRFQAAGFDHAPVHVG